MASDAGEPPNDAVEDTSDGPPAGTPITFDARAHAPTVLILDESVRADLFELWLEDFRVRKVIARSELADAFDVSIAVVVVRNELPDAVKSRLQTLVATKVPFCRTVVTTTERVEVMYPGIDYDVCLTEPTNRATIQETVGRLLLRARYDANLRNYYECSMQAANREVRLEGAELAEDEAHEKLTQRMAAIKTRLDAILDRFDEDDLDAVQRSIRPEAEFGTATRRRNKRRGEKYRPDKCVGCNLDWGVDHGGTVGEGYKRLGAFVWECTECGAVQNMPDPSHRRVAWR